MKYKLILIITALCFSCKKESPSVTIKVENKLDLYRNYETVEVDLTVFTDEDRNEVKSFKIIDNTSNEVLISQTVDLDGDGTMDILLFQPEIEANTSKLFNIKTSLLEEKKDSTLIHCYSRFVPERTDDYAWENNKVAFRTFGPTAQKMIENNIKGGTLSSGIDAWLKRVEYPIINKWYKKHITEEGSYHEDTGEGLDNFHVGVSRGVGGTAVWTDSTYAVSKNFTSYENITNGPIRTSFKLKYATWDANGKSINETKYISLDYGQNLSRYQIEIEGIDSISVGLTLHKNDGKTTTDLKKGWMSYWEPIDDSELGQGFVITNLDNLVSFNKFVTKSKDKSNLYAKLAIKNKKIDYFAGFGWKKSGQFTNQKSWEDYLSSFSYKINNPLIVTKQ